MNVASFADIEEFRSVVVVWCTATTIDRKAPPLRILHPIWEGSTGWIATVPLSQGEAPRGQSLHFAPYWTPEHKQLYAECRTEWEDGSITKTRIWELYKSTPPPLGYDPAMIWKEGPADPTYGVLKLIPWRIEVSSIMDMMSGKEPQVWRP
jgi:hypothetical protein